MDIKLIAVEDCSVIKLSECSQQGIEQAILSSVLGRVFVVGENNYYCGVFSVDSCDTFNNIDNIRQIPVIISESNLSDRSVTEQAIKIYSEKDSWKYGILPVTNNKNQLIGGVSYTESRWDKEKIVCLTRMAYYAEKKIPLEQLFISGKYKRVAFWGVDELSLTFANEIRHFKSVEMLGIYENKKRQKYINVDFLNYEVNVNFVNSLSDLLNLNADLIIVTDWTARNIGKHAVFKKSNSVVYLPGLLTKYFKSSFVNSAGINDIIEHNYKVEIETHGIKLFIVRVPTEYDINIPIKAPTFEKEDRIKWFEQQWEVQRSSTVFQEFNKAREKFVKGIKKDNGLISYVDFRSENLNYINKQRVVLNAPKEYENTIYLIGPCLVLSQMHFDDKTLGYYVQEKIIEQGLKYRVVAFGLPNDADRYYWIELLKRQRMDPGDKIFLFDQTYRQSYWDLDLLDIFSELYEQYGANFYYDMPIHCGKEANKKIAEFLCSYVEQHQDVRCECLPQTPEPEQLHDAKKTNFSANPQLKKYQEFIQNSAVHKMPKIGSIVMNCNPFTLGHQYLVEYAAAQVDYLYIFVVEEDKSYFKFEDRIELVKSGTSHLKNVKVLPSGQFIISALTFSEYFDKANLEGATIDTSLDVETFGRQIAPCLDISVRFVGEEPLDPITAQYNQSMKEILPKYGIELREIPRKCLGGVISASRVRKCLKENNWDEIKRLVPKTTYLFLERKFK